MEKITIVGGGPAGSKTALELSKLGNRVRVFEEHKKIGEPIQCTGIVTKDLFSEIKPDKRWVVNKLKHVEVNAPNGKKAVLKTEDVVIDRTEFDRWVAEEAKKEGARFILGKKITGVPTGIVVGADGPNSVIAKKIGSEMEYLIGLQAVVKGDFDPTTYKVFFGKKHPGFFGWIVPENEEIARIGTAGHYNPKIQLDRMLKNIDGKVKVKQGGIIPIYNPRNKICKEKKYLVGDAAGQVKATTGGGLVPGLQSAKILAESLTYNKNYKRELGTVRKRLQKHKMLRGMLDRFTDKDYNRLVDLLNRPGLQQVLEKETREKPGKILIKGVIKEPKVLQFISVLFRAKPL